MSRCAPSATRHDERSMTISEATKTSWNQFRQSQYYSFLTVAFRLLVGFIFLAAAYPKIQDLEAFTKVVQTYNILPDDLDRPFAYALPAIEMVAGIMLILGLRTRKAAWAIAIMLLLFIFVILVNIGRGSEAICGCFGVEEGGEALGWNTIFRDVILLILTFHIILGKRFVLTLDSVILKFRARSK